MPDIPTILTIILLGLGGAFCFLAALGVLLMPDLYNRMQATSKAVTLGATSMVLAVATHYGEAYITTRCLLAGIFLFITVPVGSHLIARAAHRVGEPVSSDTVMDELKESEQGKL